VFDASTDLHPPCSGIHGDVRVGLIEGGEIVRVVAVESIDDGAPIEAILVSEEKPKDFHGWWGGYAIERVDIGSVESLVHSDPKWRAHQLDLPAEWREGYLEARAGEVVFVSGPVPARTDWKVGRRPGEWWRLALMGGLVGGQFAVGADAIANLPRDQWASAWRLCWLVFGLALVASTASTIRRARSEGLVERNLHEVKEKSWRMQEKAAALMWPMVGAALLIDDFVPPLYLAIAVVGFAGVLLPLIPAGIWTAHRAGRLWRK